MKKLLIIISALFMFNFMSAQDVFNASSGNFTSTNYQISYSVGELIIDTYVNGIYVVHGINAMASGFSAVFVNDINCSVSAFPNPTMDFVNLKIDNYNNVSYTLMDLTGKILLTDRLNSELNVINLLNFKPGVYMLNVESDDRTIKQIFKIIKK